MKTRSVFLTILSLALITQMMMSVNSYPGIAGGYMQCYECHNEPATTGYNGTFALEDMIVDGNDTEVFWEDGDYQRIYVPIGNNVGDGHDFQFARTTFSQNSTHLFIMVRMHDDDADIEGADAPYYATADKIALIWNINATNVNMAYPTGMGGTYAADEAVDLWMWSPTVADSEADTAENDSRLIPGVTLDAAYAPGYMKDDTNDVSAAGLYDRSLVRGSYAHDYYVEFARPFITDDPQDVQFDHTGYYEYTMAIWNGSSGSAHYVSFSHFVWIENGPGAQYEVQTVVVTDVVDVTNSHDITLTNTIDFTDTKTDTPYLIVPMLAALFAGTMVIFRRRK